MAEAEDPRGELLSPGMTLLVPVIIGVAVLLVAVVASHRFLASEEAKRGRQKLIQARDLLRECLSQTEREEYEAAEKTASRAVLLAPELHTAYFFRGKARANLGQFKEAIADYSESIRRNPDKEDTYQDYFARGKAHLQLSMLELAERDFSKALAVQKYFGEALVARALVRKQLGNESGAEDDLKRARQLGTAVKP